MHDITLDSVDEAIRAMREGRFVIIADDEDRENEGDLVISADCVTAEHINFLATHGRGLICLAMHETLIDRLGIPMMVPQAENSSGYGTGFTISIEAAQGVSTGISAADRAHTIKVLIDPASTRADIAMPGHMFPLRARPGGVLERRGQTEASVDLAVLAGHTPAGVICEVMEADGEMMRLPGLVAFGRQHGIPVITVEQLARYRLDQGERLPDTPRRDEADSTNDRIALIGTSELPTRHGVFSVSVFRDRQGLEHCVLQMGAGDSAHADPIMVRLHSECLTGDAFGSLRCDCGEQLQRAMQQIAGNGRGAILYLRQEGRGIGLGNKIRAYALQEAGLDTVDANHQLGFPADARDYQVAADMLHALGHRQVRLMSNNPTKRAALEAHGITVVEQLPLVIPPHAHNADYLRTKADRMGHVFDGTTGSQAGSDAGEPQRQVMAPWQ